MIALALATRRRSIREATGRALPKPAEGEKALSDQPLSLMNLALDDRRRLETMREEAIRPEAPLFPCPLHRLERRH